jgi:uncharacterized membrane protein
VLSAAFIVKSLKTKYMEIGDSLMEVNVLVSTLEVIYGDYSFYQYSVRGQKGCIISLPFFTYNEKKESKFEGYLVYHDKDNFGYSKDELYKFGIDAIVQGLLSGMAGKLTPLPYKPISEDKIEDSLDSIIEKNTKVNLSGTLYL